MKVRIGELLVSAGVIDEAQRRVIVDEQLRTGQPFGLICERLYDIDPADVEDAWARQYASITRAVDPTAETFDEGVLAMVTRRQAWQFRVLPIRYDGDELMVATTERGLRRALCFATRVITRPTFLVVAHPLALGEALCRHYPLPGMTPDALVRDDLAGGLLSR